MSERSTDRNLLIGVLVVQMEFISRDELIHAMNEWVLDKSASLDAVLHKNDTIDDDTQRLLVALVDKHISLHADDPTESLAAVA